MTTQNLGLERSATGTPGPTWWENNRADLGKIDEVAWRSVTGKGGAAGDDVADDSTAINSILDDGLVAYFPGHADGTGRNYRVTAAAIDLAGKSGLSIVGPGTPTAGSGVAARIIHGGTLARVIDARASNGSTIRGLWIETTSASFSGKVIDADGNGPDAAYLLVDDCMVIASGSGTGLSLDKCILSTVHRSNFFNGAVGIQGQAGAGTYSNRIGITECTFQNQTVMSIRNPGQAWRIQSCGFEALSGGVVGGIDVSAAGIFAEGIEVSACWFGDATSGGGGNWVTLRVKGGQFHANWFGNTATSVGVATLDGTLGLSVTGNHFQGGKGLNVDPTNSKGWVVLGNAYTGGATNVWNGAKPKGSIIQDSDESLTVGNITMNAAATEVLVTISGVDVAKFTSAPAAGDTSLWILVQGAGGIRRIKDRGADTGGGADTTPGTGYRLLVTDN